MTKKNLTKTELESRIRMLESENAFLADRYQDYFIIGSLMESINNTESIPEVFNLFLEKICLLMEFVFGTIHAFDGIRVISLGSYSQLHDDTYHPEIIVNPVLFNNDEPFRLIGMETHQEDLIQFPDVIKINCRNVLIINLENLSFGRSIGVFCLETANLSKERQQTLLRVCDILKSRINNLYLMDQLKKMNRQLEDMVEEQSEEIILLKNLFESSGEAIIVFNDQLQPLFLNSAFQKIWKSGNIDKNAIDLFSLFDPQERIHFSEEEMRKVFNGDSLTGELEALAFDGSRFPVWFRFQKIEASLGQSYYALIAHDITAEKESELKYLNLVDHLSDGIYVLIEDKFEYINRKFSEITGYSLKDLKNPEFDIFSFFHPDSLPLIKQRLADIKAGKPVPGQYRFKCICKDGTIKHIDASVAYFPYKNGTGTQGIIRDISKQLILEEELHQAQKMESIGRLASGVAHDFNNILTVISGYSDMLAKLAATKYPEISGRIEHIVQATQHAETLTRQLLAFSRKQSIQPRSVELNSHLGNTRKILTRLVAENIQLDINTTESALNVYIDPGQLDQILINLVVNAQDAIPDGGQITIGVSRIESSRIPHSVQEILQPQDQDLVLLQVSDNGPGIPVDIMDKIFEPFFTTKAPGKGTGLGLATVYGIIQQNNGHITVESEFGKGACFKIWLPVYLGVEEELNAPALPEIKGGNQTIMIVEDNDQVREFVTQILNEYNFRTISVNSPYEAIKFFHENAATPVNLLLSDVIMPGMNGKDLYLELHKKFPGLKVLFMSGYTNDIIDPVELKSNGWEFIQKPLKIAELLGKIDSILN